MNNLYSDFKENGAIVLKRHIDLNLASQIRAQLSDPMRLCQGAHVLRLGKASHEKDLKLLNVADFVPDVLKLIQLQSVLDIVKELMGTSVRVFGIEYIRRHAKNDIAVGCHTDGGADFRKVLLHQDSIEIALKAQYMLTDMEGSPFQYIPGSHRWNYDRIADCDQAFFNDNCVSLFAGAGDVIIFSQRILHGVGAHTAKQHARESIIVKFHQSWTQLPGAMSFAHLQGQIDDPAMLALLNIHG